MKAALALAIPLILLAGGTAAQDISISLGDGGSITTRTIQLITLITVLSLAPGIAIMITCFPFIVTVLSILRQGIGLQQSPPNMLIVTLALFLTYFVMEPVFTEAWTAGVVPLLDERIEVEQAFARVMEPFRIFMAGRIDPDTYASLADLRPDVTQTLPGAAEPLSLLVPSFLLSEI